MKLLPAPHPCHSVDCFSDAKELSIITNDIEAISILSAASGHGWAQKPSNNIATMTGTGSVSSHTYSHRVAKVAVGRGGKEGDSAFIQQSSLSSFEFTIPYSFGADAGFLAAARNPEVQPQTIIQLLEEGTFSAYNFAYAAAEAGNARAVQEAFVFFRKDSSSGITDAFLLAVDASKNIDPSLQARSITKKIVHSMTPLHVAAACAPLSRFQELLQLNSLSYVISDSFGRNLVHFAAANEDPDVLSYLLSLGADPTAVDKASLTPMHLAAKFGRATNLCNLIQATRKQLQGQLGSALSTTSEKLSAREKRKHAAILKKLATAGLSKDKNGLTPLHHAAYAGHAHVFKALCKIDPEINIDLPDGNKRTPLMIAAMQGHLKAMKTLMKLRSYPEAADKRKYTALHHACKNGQFDAAQMLLRAGHSANARDSSGNTPSHYAAAFDWVKILQLLKHYSADLTCANDWKTTPLSISVAKSCITCLLYLLEQPGANVEARDNDGRTLLHHACTGALISNYRIVELLIQRGADATVKDVNNATPLLIVAGAQNGEYHCDIATLLLKAGASPDAADKSGESPLSAALTNKKADLLVTMLSSGNSFHLDQIEACSETFLHKLINMGKQRDIVAIWDKVMEQDPAIVQILLNRCRFKDGKNPIIDLILAVEHHPSSGRLLGILPGTGTGQHNPGFSSHRYWRSNFMHHQSSPSEQDDSTIKNRKKVIHILQSALQHGFNPNLTVEMDLEKEKKMGADSKDVPNASSVGQSLYDSNISSESGSDNDSDAYDDGSSISRTSNGATDLREENKIQTTKDSSEQMDTRNDDQRDGTEKPPIEKNSANTTKSKKKKMVNAKHGLELTVEAALYKKHENLLGESEERPFQLIEDLDSELGGCVPLHAACRVKNPIDIISALLDGGASPNCKDRLGQTPLMYAVVSGLPGVVSKMLLHDADVNIATFRSRQTALHMAVRLALSASANSRVARIEVLNILLENGAAPNVMDLFGDLPLCLAAEHGDQEVINALLRANADPCILDANGKSAFHFAVLAANSSLVKRILDAGADPNLPTALGNTPLHGAVRAANWDDAKQIAQDLLKAGANPNSKNNLGETPLYAAVHASAFQTYCNFEVVQCVFQLSQ